MGPKLRFLLCDQKRYLFWSRSQIRKRLLEKGLDSHRMSSCRGDGRGSSVPMPQVENKNTNQLALVLWLVDEEDAVVSRENICSLCNVRRAAVTSSVQIIICCWRPPAQFCLHYTLRPSSCIHVAVQAPNDWRPRNIRSCQLRID